ncbi:MAG: hypothetical protein MJ180_00770 [Candidatus Gastranaerophilales bacterium]|nr:hypothetical protein [Candidatus Gastranaerophilales bacterium]
MKRLLVLASLIGLSVPLAFASSISRANATMTDLPNTSIHKVTGDKCDYECKESCNAPKVRTSKATCDCSCPPPAAGYKIVNYNTCQTVVDCPDYGKIYIMSLDHGALNRSLKNLLLQAGYTGVIGKVSPDRSFYANKGSSRCVNSNGWGGYSEKTSGCSTTTPANDVVSYILSENGSVIAEIPYSYYDSKGKKRNMISYPLDSWGVVSSGLYNFIKDKGSNKNVGPYTININNYAGLSCSYTAWGYYRNNSPLIFDLNNDGLEFTSIEDGIVFDLNADGDPDEIAWTKEQTKFDNAFLVYDHDTDIDKKDGQITSGKELFGDQNGEENGYKELAKYDLDGDGNITVDDPIYFDLQLWCDMNKNGITDEGELHTLEEEGIISISTEATVKYDESGDKLKDEYGNDTSLWGKFTRYASTIVDGVKQFILDVVEEVHILDVFFRTK